MMINPNFVSPCGLYCGVCAIYISHRDNNQKFKERIGGCTRIHLHVISTEGRNLKLKYFQCNKISRYARNDTFAEFSDSLIEIFSYKDSL